jgi:hypothetical protein
MDFDPGELYDDSYENFDEIAEDNYEEGFEDGQEEVDDMQQEPEVEYDDDGNVIAVVAAAGFGYHMATDEIDERQLAEDVLARREGKTEPVKIPLAKRHEAKGHMTPFGRWATRANLDHKRTEDEIEYTKEEQLEILRAEGD